MTPIKFRESNEVVASPKGMEAQVLPLHVLANGISLISCWEPTEEEMEYIIKNKKIWVQVMGNVHPVMSVFAGNPMRDDIAEFTQIRIRVGRPRDEALIAAEVERSMLTFVDKELFDERRLHVLVERNSDQHRKIMANHLLWVISDKNEGFAKLFELQFYDMFFTDREVIPDDLHISLYIKKDLFVQDMRNNTVNPNLSTYMFLES